MSAPDPAFLADSLKDCEPSLIERLRTSNGPGGVRRADLLELCEEFERLREALDAISWMAGSSPSAAAQMLPEIKRRAVVALGGGR